jgi:ribosome-binding ATPase YchF (GTP1/OBG family)
VDEVDYIYDRDTSMATAEAYAKQLQYCDLEKDSFAVVSAKFENELSTKSDEEKRVYLDSIGAVDGLNLNEQLSYHRLPLLVKDVLDLELVYTGPGVSPERSQTTKTHIIPSKSISVLDLAGKLHGDIQKGVMNAEVIRATDLIQYETYGRQRLCAPK